MGGLSFKPKESPGSDTVLYLIAKGGEFTVNKGSGDNPAIALFTVLGGKPPAKVVINELTTVASVFTAARFINGESISGNPLGLRIAAGNVPNLVDPATGTWGKVLLDPINSTQTTTLANLNTLGSLITAFPPWPTTIGAPASSRPQPRPAVRRQRTLLRLWPALPASRGLTRTRSSRCSTKPTRNRRTAPGARLPSCRTSPDPARLRPQPLFRGRRRVRQWPVHVRCGRQPLERAELDARLAVRRHQSIGGGVVKFTPNGTALSPPITGFTGMGMDGVGWGTAVTLDKVWITSFNGKILVMDFDGHPIGKESDFPFKEKSRD